MRRALRLPANQDSERNAHGYKHGFIDTIILHSLNKTNSSSIIFFYVCFFWCAFFHCKLYVNTYVCASVWFRVLVCVCCVSVWCVSVCRSMCVCVYVCCVCVCVSPPQHAHDACWTLSCRTLVSARLCWL